MSLRSWNKEYGGYIPCSYIVLDTFGSDIKFNPHILITTGGLSLDHKRWIHAPDTFIMPEICLFYTKSSVIYIIRSDFLIFYTTDH